MVSEGTIGAVHQQQRFAQGAFQKEGFQTSFWTWKTSLAYDFECPSSDEIFGDGQTYSYWMLSMILNNCITMIVIICYLFFILVVMEMRPCYPR